MTHYIKSKRRRRGLWILGVAGLFVVLLNISAYNQAWKMTHFVAEGTLTPSPEKLSRIQKVGVLFKGVTIPKPRCDVVPSEVGLESESIGLTARDGVKLAGWYIWAKAGKGTVLLFHGYKSSRSGLLSEAKVFHDLGWDVMMTDFRGSGESEGQVTTIGVAEAMDVAAANQWVAKRNPGRPVVLFGTSMGAAAVLNAMDKGWVHPTVIILECPFDRLLTTVKHRFEAIGLPTFPLAGMLVFWGGVQNGFNGFNHNPVDYARSVSCPVLILHGTKDPRVKMEEVNSIQSALKGQSTLHEFPQSGHESYCRSHPEEYRRVIEDWLSAKL